MRRSTGNIRLTRFSYPLVVGGHQGLFSVQQRYKILVQHEVSTKANIKKKTETKNSFTHGEMVVDED